MQKFLLVNFIIIFSLFSQITLAQGSLRADVYKVLEEAKVAQDEGRLDDVFEVLNKLKARSGKKTLKPYEIIQLHNFYAYAWLAKENYPKALLEFNALLSKEKVPEAIISQTQMTVAQLYLATDQPDKSIAMLKKWLNQTQSPTPDAYVLMSQAYLQKKDIDAALPPLLTAFNLAKTLGRKEKENWYALLQYIYANKKQYANQEKALEVLVNRWPKAQWWLALGGAYAQQEKEAKQLYAMDAAYQQGLFTRGEYIVSMSQLLAIQGAPYYAAKALKKGLDSGLVDAGFKNHSRLADYYQRAQEFDFSIEYYKKSIEQAEDGELSLRLAYVFMRQYDYRQAVKYINKALDQGGLRNTIQAKLLLGEANYHSKNFQTALTVFDAVLVDTQNFEDKDGVIDINKKRYYKQASRWLSFTKNESKRQDGIKQWLNNNG